MVQDNEKPGAAAAAAQEAIRAAQSAEAASRRRAIPSKLYGLTLALAVGVTVGLVAAGREEFGFLAILVFAIQSYFFKKKMGVEPELIPHRSADRRKFILLLAAVTVLNCVAIVVIDVWSLSWGPYALAGFMAVLTYALFVREREAEGKRIDTLLNTYK